MASMLVQHTVKNYVEWKKGFDSHQAMRTAGGELSFKIYRDSADANKLTIMNKWDSLANAQKFIQSPELRAGMEQSGVIGMPVVTFLNEA